MGLFNKIKDILFEEETVEIPVVSQKEEIKKIQDELRQDKVNKIENNNLDLPKERNVKKESSNSVPINEVNEKDLYKSEPTFPFPLAFDEEPVPSRSKNNATVKSMEKPKKTKEKIKKEIEKLDEKPVVKERNSTPFRPSPVISPVYGILDKNYKKEDLVEKNRRNNHKIDIDKVREKAFGDNLKASDLQSEDIFTVTEDGKTVDELLIDTLSINLDNMKEEKKVAPKNNKTDKIIDNIDTLKKEEVKEEKKDENIEEDTLETDLFNLIDSMYEKKDGE